MTCRIAVSISTYEGAEHVDAVLRPVEFKRALSNLTDNAGHYGTQITVRLLAEEQRDPDSHRRQWSRCTWRNIYGAFSSLSSGSIQHEGATRAVSASGLTIASRVISEAGGRLTLNNRPEGGLCAEIELPRPAAPSNHSSRSGCELEKLPRHSPIPA